jgi:hypothetical protein
MFIALQQNLALPFVGIFTPDGIKHADTWLHPQSFFVYGPTRPDN